LRSRRVIEVDPKIKSRYISTKKGSANETHVLTINSKAFLKKTILHKDHHFNCHGTYNKFIYSKANLGNFKKLFQQYDKLLCDVGKVDDQNSESKSFKDFCEEELCKSKTIKKILYSKKMNLHNKLILIKYLHTLKNSCLNPERFLNWKGIHHINPKS
jgi:hypothetical protein